MSRYPPVDLQGHLGQCEVNYHRCLELMPGCRADRTEWSLAVDAKSFVEVDVAVHELATHTTTVDIRLRYRDAIYLQPPRLRVRLYHDAQLAEVVGWNRERQWLPRYPYPNKNMYQRDEKLSLNRFLGDLLVHCRKLGMVANPICESIRINKN
jgi:uncharacterized protein